MCLFVFVAALFALLLFVAPGHMMKCLAVILHHVIANSFKYFWVFNRDYSYAWVEQDTRDYQNQPRIALQIIREFVINGYFYPYVGKGS